MEFIIEFYKGLDALNLIIFWGIIIVIILLLIFAFILLNKNKKLKSMIVETEKKEELPIKNLDKSHETNIESIDKTEKEIILPPIPEIPKESNLEQNNITKQIEIEKKFVAEEHVMEYNKDLFALSNIKKATEHQESLPHPEANKKTPIEIPNKPYQRNVLREMSLSQTSPIGINSKERKEDKTNEIAKDLETSLNNNEKDLFSSKEEINDTTQKKESSSIDKEIRQELNNISDSSVRKTQIKIEHNTSRERMPQEKKEKSQTEITFPSDKELALQETEVDEKSKDEVKETRKNSAKYLEEVSRKLAEAEIPGEIERTNYELQQEEEAIISYKELMEKKDSIQTVDEEEAVISIEELMSRNNKKENHQDNTSNNKLYNLSEEEENESFIKELKQFRNDL